ncbi:hypothetical protein [Spirosoma arcticum]
MALFIKPTVSNIINLWFGADTPIRQNKIKYNPELWAACQRVNQGFRPASKKRLIEQYRKPDQVAFARAVQQELDRSKVRSSLSQKNHSLA